MLDKIKEDVKKLIGKNVKIVVDIGRNKIEEYDGKIIKTHDNIWLFSEKENIRSFSYTDILIKTVTIIPQ